MSSLPAISELMPFVVGLVCVGAVSGFLAGMFGIGGGAILVPFFYQMLGLADVDDAVRMHLSVGTSLAIIAPTSVRSFLGHKAKGAVDMELLRRFVIWVPVGVISASVTVAYISGGMLRMIFAYIALAIALKMLLGKDHWKLADEIPTGAATNLAGWFIGFFSTFMGIGGGVFNNTFMTAFGRKIHQAVATSAGVGVLIAIPGLFGYLWAGWGDPLLPPFSIGYVNVLMVMITVPVTLLTAPFGVNVAHKLNKRQLEIGLGIFLILVSARFFYSLYG